MTQIDVHPDRPAMRDRAQALIAGFDALPAPQTLLDMLRTARLLMALDRLLSQLWKAPADKSAGQRVATADKAPENTPVTEPQPQAPHPLNRQQRRALDAQNKAVSSKDVCARKLSVAPTIARYATDLARFYGPATACRICFIRNHRSRFGNFPKLRRHTLKSCCAAQKPININVL